MGKREPNYRRAFWITAAIVGVLNVAFAIYFSSCPEKPIGKGGEPVKAISDWAMPIVAIDFPGLVLTIPFWAGRRTVPELDANLILCAVGVLSTAFWGAIAVTVEWLSFRNRTANVNPPAPSPDAPSDSD